MAQLPGRGTQHESFSKMWVLKFAYDFCPPYPGLQKAASITDVTWITKAGLGGVTVKISHQ